jgi:hypothetical protein
MSVTSKTILKQEIEFVNPCKMVCLTLITVQWCNDVDSQAKGAMSLLGTPEGTLLVTTVNDKIVHITTMNGTP